MFVDCADFPRGRRRRPNIPFLPSIFSMAFFDWACLLSPWTAVFLPKVAVFLILRPILMYRNTMIVMGMMKNMNEENSKRKGGVGIIVQNADSGIVWKVKRRIGGFFGKRKLKDSIFVKGLLSTAQKAKARNKRYADCSRLRAFYCLRVFWLCLGTNVYSSELRERDWNLNAGSL